MEFYLSKNDLDRVEMLLCKGEPFHSYNDAFEIIRLKARRRFVISFLNMHAIQQCLKNELFFKSLIDSDLILFDGIALKILCKFFGKDYGKNMNGSDFLPVLISKFKDKKYTIFASNDVALNMFMEKHKDLDILTALNGFHSYDKYIKEIKKEDSDIILLGMGMPKQEILSSMINKNSIIINGGAIIDYMSGFKSRCPGFFTRCNLEWLYRIFYEPKRLFKRYADGLIILFKIITTNRIYEKKGWKTINTEVSLSIKKGQYNSAKNKIKPSRQGVS